MSPAFKKWYCHVQHDATKDTHTFFAEQHLTTKAEEHELEPGTKKRLPGAEGPPEGEHVLEQVAVICSVPLGPLGRKASSAASIR